MIVLTNTTEQVVQPGQAIVFDKTVFNKGICTCHRVGSTSVKMTRKCAVYEVEFSANIGSPTETTPVQLTLEVGGEPLPETVMISTSAAAGDLNNVSKSTFIPNCCGDLSRITVVNTGTAPVNIGAYPTITLKQIA